MLLLPAADLPNFLVSTRFKNLFSENSVNSVSVAAAAAAPDAVAVAVAAPAVVLVTVGRPR